MRKVIALTIVLLLGFSSVSFAAVSSSKSVSRPRTSTGTTTVKPSTPTAAPNTSTSGYKPSAPASSYSDKAPAAQTKPGTAPQQQPSTGGFLRNVGLFGGGMLLGGLLSNMFGFGNMGLMASLMGMLFNVLFLVAIFMAIRWVWNYVTSRRKDQEKDRNYRP